MKSLLYLTLLGLASAAAVQKRAACPTYACCGRYAWVWSGATCQQIADVNGISLNTFYDLNPTIDRNDCPNMMANCNYCVQGCGSPCPPKVATCCKYAWVWPGATCQQIADANGIPLNTFYDLNPSIDRNDCPNMLANCEYCVRGQTWTCPP